MIQWNELIHTIVVCMCLGVQVSFVISVENGVYFLLILPFTWDTFSDRFHTQMLFEVFTVQV